MRSSPVGPSTPIVAYRWFQVGEGGALSGAQDIEWPVDEPMRARHVGMLDDAGVVLKALKVIIGIAAVVCALALAAGIVLLVVMLATGRGTAMDRLAATMDIIGATWGLLITVAMEVLAPLPSPGPDHRCPGKARRVVGRWTPPCGIYAYRDLARAAAGTRGAWVLTDPLVLAQVLVWGSVYEHRGGYRSELARIEALYDDGGGHVEVPAATYGVPTLPYPDDVDAVPLPGTRSGSRLIPRRWGPRAGR